MTTLLIVFAGLLGLAFGSFANVLAYRVPRGASLLQPSRCPSCGARIRPWQLVPIFSWVVLGGRCAECAERIPFRYLVIEATNAVAFAALAWFVPATLGVSGTPGLLVWGALAWLAVVSSALVVIDLDTRTLPNAIVLPSYGVGLVMLGLASAFEADWAAMLRAFLGMAGMYAAYLAIRLVRPGGMGGGDVKLAGLTGIYLGWVGWGALAVGWLAAFLLGGGFALAMMASGRATRHSAIPFGPWILAGAWVGIWFGEQLWSSYAAMSGLVLTKG